MTVHPGRHQPAFNRVRNARRATYEAETVHAILDRGILGHVGFVHEGRPMVIPMAYARVGETIYLHGASKARIVTLTRDAPLSMAVTLLDGIVAARSGMHHSANYRSAVVHGRGRAVVDSAEHDAALQAVTEHLLPGRYEEVRPINAQERKATGVAALEIEAASAKTRAGPPVDDEADLELGLWGGVLPIVTSLGETIADGHTPAGTAEPASMERARRKFGG